MDISYLKNKLDKLFLEDLFLNSILTEEITIFPSPNIEFKNQKMLYKKAVESINELGEYFNKNVLLNDSNFEITFKYDLATINKLRFDPHLAWIIFPNSKSITEHDTEEFIVKDRKNIGKIYKKAAKILLDKSKKYFNTFTPLVSHSFSTEEVNSVTSMPYFARSWNFVDMIFKKSRGLCVGEHHDELAKIEFFDDIKGFLRMENITIFLEWPTSALQKDIDYYLDKDTDIDDIPPALFWACNSIVPKNSNPEIVELGYNTQVGGSLALIRLAKAAGIKKIIAIDTKISRFISYEEERGYYSFNSNFFEGRYLSMNFEAKQIINQHLHEDEKFIIFSGLSHVVKSSGVLGFGELLGVPTLSLRQLPYKEPKDVSYGYRFITQLEKNNEEKTIYCFKGTDKKPVQHLDELDYKADFCMTFPTFPLTSYGATQEEKHNYSSCFDDSDD